MEIRYDIPKHLEGILGNIPEDKLGMLLTVIFEYAIQHRMLDYPKMEIEKEVTFIKQLCSEIKSKQTSEFSMVLQLLTDVNDKLNRMEKPVVHLGVLAEKAETVYQQREARDQIALSIEEAYSEEVDPEDAGFFSSLMK